MGFLRATPARAALAAAFLSLAAGPARAQRVDAWIDATGAHAVPPSGAVVEDASTFGSAGVRARVLAPRGLAFDASAHGGRAVAGTGSGWWHGTGAASLVQPLSRGTVSVRAEAYGSSFREPVEASAPFRYATHGVSVTPRWSLRVGPAVLEARGEATRGRWSARIPVDPDGGGSGPILPPWVPARPPGQDRERDGETARASGPVALTGAAVEARVPRGPLGVHAGIERFEARGADGTAGLYTAATSGVTGSRGAIDLAAMARWQRGPTGEDELGVQFVAGFALGAGTYAHLSAGRAVSEPLYGTPPHTTVRAGVSVRVGGFGVRGRAEQPVVEVGDRVTGGRRVRFRLHLPDAGQVAVAGDFSGWEPLPMRRSGEDWVLETVLQPGLHHFSFVVDGSRWLVPDHAPGIVDDGWGQQNGSVLIEGD